MVRLKTVTVVELAALVVFGVAGVRVASSVGASLPPAHNQQSKNTAAPSDKSKTAAPASGCSMLTPAMLQKVLGQPFGDPSESKAPPAYGQQPWGSNCLYSAHGSSVDFIVYIEASPQDAKQTFEKLAMWYPAKSKPSGIGDSAYIDSKDAIHVLKGKVRYYIAINSEGPFTPAKEKQLKDLATAVAAEI